MKKEAIIIFTRIPYPGKTKTRLMPCYTGSECATLHRYFLLDIVGECEKSKRDIYVFYEPNGELSVIKQILGNDKIYYQQEGNTIGERMKNAMNAVLDKEYEACVLIGTDIPQLEQSIMEEAFEKLKQVDVVIGPTTDGGYYLIGSKGRIDEAFEQIEYGSKTVFNATKNRIIAKGKKIEVTETLTDIDVPRDIHLYRKINIQNKTMSYLQRNPKISAIVPIYNEEKTITVLQEQLEKLKDCEIILVDGGSTDRTRRLISDKYRVIESKKGRANQMNAGAKSSGGEILFFLHCDSVLQGNPAEEIRRVMRSFRWGCFGVVFQSKKWIFSVCSFMSNLRASKRVPFGDQGIFIHRDLFFEIGGFPELPIMEDYQLSLTLKSRGERIGMTKNRISTSARRFGNTLGEQLKVMWKMHHLRRLYRKGVSVDKLAKSYQDVR